MTKRARSLRRLLSEPLSFRDLQALGKEIDEGSDRSVAIISAARLQNALEQLILTALPCKGGTSREELYSRDGPLSSFYAATILAAALDLIDEQTKRQLNIVRNIRNAFAHAAKPIGFRTPEVLVECHKLIVPTATNRPIQSGRSAIYRVHMAQRECDAKLCGRSPETHRDCLVWSWSSPQALAPPAPSMKVMAPSLRR